MPDLRDSIENDLRRSDRGSPWRDLRAADERREFLVTNGTDLSTAVNNRARAIAFDLFARGKLRIVAESRDD